MIAGGMLWYTLKNEEVDYKKYLGPDWKPTDRKPSTIVCNHSVWMDILLGVVAFDFPIFTSRVGIKKWLFVGVLASYPGYQAIFLDRAGTKEERD